MSCLCWLCQISYMAATVTNIFYVQHGFKANNLRYAGNSLQIKRKEPERATDPYPVIPPF